MRPVVAYKTLKTIEHYSSAPKRGLGRLQEAGRILWRTPLYFRLNWGPKGRKKVFWDPFPLHLLPLASGSNTGRWSFMEGSNRAALTEKTLEFWIVGRLWEVGEHGGSTKDSSDVKYMKNSYLNCGSGWKWRMIIAVKIIKD